MNAKAALMPTHWTDKYDLSAWQQRQKSKAAKCVDRLTISRAVAKQAS